MNKTTDYNDKPLNERLLVDDKNLCALLSCGHHTARKIAERANARVDQGKRVFWNVRKIQEYIEKESY